jgi:hypothetical protein
LLQKKRKIRESGRINIGALLGATKGNLINKDYNGKAVRVTMQLPSADLLGFGKLTP